MSGWTVFLIVVFALVAAGCLFGFSGDVDSARAHKLVEEGATLVDVRSPEEFQGGHIDGALNIPVSDISARMSEIPKDKPVVVYCHSGMRAKSAASTLKDAGYEEIYNLGAMSRW